MLFLRCTAEVDERLRLRASELEPRERPELAVAAGLCHGQRDSLCCQPFREILAVNLLRWDWNVLSAEIAEPGCATQVTSQGSGLQLCSRRLPHLTCYSSGLQHQARQGLLAFPAMQALTCELLPAVRLQC